MTRVFLVAFAVGFLIGGCNKTGSKYSTLPDDGWGEREYAVASNLYKRCEELGVRVEVEFTDDKYVGLFGTAAMWSYGEDDLIMVWRPIIYDRATYTDEIMDAYARHECAHCFYDHQSYNGDEEHDNGMETQADTCANVLWPNC